MFICRTNASIRIQDLIRKNPLQSYLRVAVVGGGCSGFQYEFNLVGEKQLDDIFIPLNETLDLEFEGREIGILIDNLSYDYLESAELDYVCNLSGARFAIINSKEQSSCGCGLSIAFD